MSDAMPAQERPASSPAAPSSCGSLPGQESRRTPRALWNRVAPTKNGKAPLARACLLAAFVLSSWGYWYRLGDYPPYLDYDSATLGIFVNNVSFHDDYAYGLRGSSLDQNRYRANWAAEFLPASVVLGRLQQWLAVPPDAVGDLLKVVGMLCGVLGLASVVAIMRHHGRCTVDETLFVAGFTASLPAFLLYLRTTEPHFLYSFLMFWSAVACIDRYLGSGSRRALYALGACIALYALVPYVPLAVLPLTGFVLAIVRRRVVATLRDPHLYAAAASSIALLALLQYGVAVTHEPSWEAWRGRTAQFFAARARHVAPGSPFDPATLGDKVTKLYHQHFVHRWDTLGDQKRNDHLWTMPAPHLVWVVLIPVALLGVWYAWRVRDAAAAVYAAVLSLTYGLALTVSYPEGRYLLTAVPCLSYFVLCGLRALAGGTAPFPAVLAAVLTATTLNSYLLIRGEYNSAAMRRWRAMAGMRETIELIHREFGGGYGRTKDLHLHWPDLNYEAWLYLEMLGNMRVEPFAEQSNLAGLAVGEPLFAAVEATDAAALQTWRRKGLRDAGPVTDRPSGRRFVVLAAPP